MGKAKRESKRLIEQLLQTEKAIAESEQIIAKLQTEKAKFIADTLTENGPGWKQTSLQDLLTKDQIQAVVDILNRPNLDDIAQTKLLKDYLRQYAQQLEAKGVLPDYLAYVLIHQADQIRFLAAMWN
jgi:hypothetical protein